MSAVLKPGNRPQILDACCGGRHWWWNKSHPLAVYMDIEQRERGSVEHRPNWECQPSVVGDFRAIPFEDESFQLVLFDPPHIVRPNPSGRIVATFGALTPHTEQDDLKRGFAECWRVLASGGTMIFKWAGAMDRVSPHFPVPPIVGTRSPRGGQTRWFVFYKPLPSPTRPYTFWARAAETHENAIREAIGTLSGISEPPPRVLLAMDELERALGERDEP